MGEPTILARGATVARAGSLPPSSGRDQPLRLTDLQRPKPLIPLPQNYRTRNPPRKGRREPARAILPDSTTFPSTTLERLGHRPGRGGVEDVRRPEARPTRHA